MRSSLKGPVSYRAAIVLTAVGLVLFSTVVIVLIEIISGDLDVNLGPLEKWLIVTGLIFGLALFVIGAVDGAQREVEQLEDERVLDQDLAAVRKFEREREKRHET